MRLDPKTTPEIPLHLLEWLDRLIPEQSRYRTETNDDSLWNGGRRSVLHLLWSVYNQQNNIK